MIYRSFEAGCGCTSAAAQSARCRCVPHCCCPFPHLQPQFPPQPPFPPQPRGISLLNTAATGAVAVAVGSTLPFELNNVSVGSDISHAAGTGIVSLNTPGVYLVTFTGTAGPAAAADVPTTIEAELRLNGTAIPGASSTNTYALATDTGTFAITTAVNVTTVPATLSVVIPEGGATFSDASLTVQKVGTISTTPPLTQTPYYY